MFCCGNRGRDHVTGPCLWAIGIHHCQRTDEVTLAHNQLSGQIAEARGQLDTLSTIMARRQGESSALQKAREDLARLKATAREQESELRKARQERDMLERKNGLTEQQKLRQKEKELAERDAFLNERDADLENTRRALGRTEQNLAAQREQFERAPRGRLARWPNRGPGVCRTGS